MKSTTRKNEQDSKKVLSEVNQTIFAFERARKYLQVSSSKLYQMVRYKELTYLKPNRLLYFRKVDLDAYLLSREILSDKDMVKKIGNNINK